MTARILSERERAFCAGVAAGRSATQAARDAGYSDKGGGASVSAHRLMQRQEVLAQIKRLHDRGEKVREAAVSGLLIEAVKSGRMPAKAAQIGGAHVEAGLTRAFQQHALVTATAMALGQVPMPRTMVIRPKPTEDDPNPVPIVVETEVREADPRAAAYCAAAMGEEIARTEGADRSVPTIEGEVMDAGAIDAARAARGLPPVPDDFDPDKEP